MSICRRVVSPAELGDYLLHVSTDSFGVVLNGIHAVNGEKVRSWTHAELIQGSPHTIVIGAKERHRIKVMANFTGAANATVELTRNGETLRTCELEHGEATTSDMSILAPK